MRGGNLRRAVIAAALTLLASGAAATLAVAARDGVAPREFVVVALGDSYGAGEGAPAVDGAFTYDAQAARWVGTAPTWSPAGDAASRRCHRSTRSGFDRAIALLRQAFASSNVTVTYRSFACSGAGIRSTVDPATGLPQESPKGGGALEPYEGVPSERRGAAPFAPQVAQARSFLAVAGKRADAVVMSFGGNDFGFGRLVFLCGVLEYLLDANAPASTADACDGGGDALAVVTAAAGPTSVAEPLTFAPEGLLRRCAFLTRASVVSRACRPSLRASYDLLGAALRGATPQTFRRCTTTQEAAAEALQPFSPVGTTKTVFGVSCRKQAANSLQRPVGAWVRVERTYPALAARGRLGGLRSDGRVYITSYPDPLEDETGALCDRRPADDRASRKLLLSESRFIRDTVRPALIQHVQGAATRNGWTFVPVGSAARHGICADEANRFFKANVDALRTQGEDIAGLPRPPGGPSEPALSGGYVHPNAAGYEALYARQLASRLRTQVCARFALAACPPLPAAQLLPARSRPRP